MTNNDELAMNLKSAAEIATPGEWERGDGKHGGELLVYCDDALGSAVCEATSTYNSIPKLQRISNLTFIATANPANMLALLAERDADKKRIAELDKRNAELNSTLERWSTDRAQSSSDLDDAQKRIAELEALTADQDKRLISYAAIATKNAMSVKPAEQYADDSELLFAIDLNDDCESYQTAQWLKELRRRRAADIKLEVGE